MAIKPLVKRILKITGIAAGILLLLLGGLYWWFVHHAESILRDIVKDRSNGTVALNLRSVTYNFDEHRLNLRGAVLYNTDSLKTHTAYQIRVSKLSVQLRSLLPLLLNRELVIDSILISQPDIRVTKNDTLVKRSGSLTTEIGQLYNNIHKGLSLFSVGYFRLEKGKFTLANRARTDWNPVTITNIYFYINNYDSTNKGLNDDGRYQYNQHVFFETDHQQLTFPDGRYSMGFSRFRINVKQRSIEMDSCTLATNEGADGKTGIRLYFDKLRFSGIDLTALYATNTLRADSMYALNPVANIKVQVDSAALRTNNNAGIDSLLQQVGLNLQLKYMGVKNISTSLVTVRNGQAASYHTKHDDFELHDIKVDHDAAEPVIIGGFNIAIRGYSSLTKDSSYIFRFDSVRFFNSRVLLNNFSITSTDNATVQRHHTLPLFELDNLSWEELIFNRHIKAREAVLHSPVIHYTKDTRTAKGKSPSMYSILHSLDNTMSLERIRILNGELSYAPNPDVEIKLDAVDLTVSTDRLLSARTTAMLGNAVDSLHFKKGSIHTRKLQVAMTNGSFRGNGTQLQADELTVNDVQKQTFIKAQRVEVEGITFEENSNHLSIQAARYKDASISINKRTAAPVQPAAQPVSWELHELKGGNTNLSLTSESGTLTTFTHTLLLEDVAKANDKAIHIKEFHLEGNKLYYSGRTLSLQCRDYKLSNQSPSVFNEVYFSQYTSTDSITISMPQLQCVLDQQALTGDQTVINELILHHPAIYLNGKAKEEEETRSALSAIPAFHINRLELQQPFVSMNRYSGHQYTHLIINQQGNDQSWVMENIGHPAGAPVTIGSLNIAVNDLTLKRSGEKPLTVQVQQATLQIKNTTLKQETGAETEWMALLKKASASWIVVNTFKQDSTRLRLTNIEATNLNMQSARSSANWISHSPDFRISNGSGHYYTALNNMTWQNLQYDHSKRTLSLDSFAFKPVPDKWSYIAAHPWQTDFIKLHTGHITVHEPDMHGLFKDSMTHISSIRVQQPVLYVYRDKRPPFRSGIIKPLPVNVIRQLPIQLSIDSIFLRNGEATYEEFSNKTQQTGSIPFTQLNAVITGFRTGQHKVSDSLLVDAQAVLLDSIYIKVGFHESYTDTLASFHMTTQVSAVNLTNLNSIVEPLTSVKIRSGQLDTLTLNAIGREHLSYGEMQVIYRKLHVQFVQGGENQQKTFLTRLMSFITNSFVIRNRNEHKTGIIYFERLRDRSVFNYMIKMLFSGAGSSMGIRMNKKYIQAYRKELKKQKLPPITSAYTTQ